MKKLIIIMLAALTITGCKEDKPKKPVEYIVTFDSDGGTVVPKQTVEAGGTATAPDNPVKKDYIFLFWRLSGASTAYNFQTPVNSDITLVAKWEEEAKVEYWQVTWELNGGAWPAGDNHATQVVKGGTLAEPAEPEKPDSEFAGWYKEAELTNEVTFPYDVSAVTENITLYAGWQEETNDDYWRVTWELNGGEWTEGFTPITQVAKDGTLTGAYYLPIKTGNTFEGWYTDTSLTNRIYFPYSVTDNITIYAKWTENVGISWELNDGAWTEGFNPRTSIVKGGMLALPRAPVKAGYIFGGWYAETSLTNRVTFPYSVTDDITLYAKWDEPKAVFLGTWLDQVSNTLFNRVTFYDDRFSYLNSNGSGFSISELTWTEVDNQSNFSPSYSTGYKITGRLSAKSGYDNAIQKADGSGFATQVGDIVMISFFINVDYDPPQIRLGNFYQYGQGASIGTFIKGGRFEDNMDPLEKAVYCVSHIITVRNNVLSGLRPTLISGVANIFYNANGTLNYMTFIPILARANFTYDLPTTICSAPANPSSNIRNGAYDFDLDPSSINVYFGILPSTTLDGLRTIANNPAITPELYARMLLNSNTNLNMVVYGRNKNGVTIGKYLAYPLSSLSSSGLTYWPIDPDDPLFGYQFAKTNP